MVHSTKFTHMANRKEIERLERDIVLLEQEVRELRTIEPDVINERFRLIEETLYSTKEILNMKEVCQYLNISPSHLYKLTSNREIPHFKPGGKLLFFERNELMAWIRKNHCPGSESASEHTDPEPHAS